MVFKNNALPIYQQIVSMFEYDIASGKLLAGEKLSSIRDLALIYKVNPNTMAKALSQLEDIGLIYTDRTNGKYVVDDKERLRDSKNNLFKKDTRQYIMKTRQLNMSLTETLLLVEKLWEEYDE